MLIPNESGISANEKISTCLLLQVSINLNYDVHPVHPHGFPQVFPVNIPLPHSHFPISHPFPTKSTKHQQVLPVSSLILPRVLMDNSPNTGCRWTRMIGRCSSLGSGTPPRPNLRTCCGGGKPPKLWGVH